MFRLLNKLDDCIVEWFDWLVSWMAPLFADFLDNLTFVHICKELFDFSVFIIWPWNTQIVVNYFVSNSAGNKN